MPSEPPPPPDWDLPPPEWSPPPSGPPGATGDETGTDPSGATPLRQPPRQLHPFSIVRGIQLRSLLGALPALFFLGADPDVPSFVLLAGAALISVVVLVVRVLAWQRHTYEFAGGRIIEKSGIISRQERALEVERIQQVDVEQTILDRLVGTCELRMETAADSGDSELTLRVVTEEEATRLQALLARRVGADTSATFDSTGGGVPASPGAPGAPTVSQPAPQRQELAAVSIPQVALAAVTGPRLLAVPAAIAVFFGVVAENAAPDEIVDTAGSAVTGLSALGAVLLFLGLAVGSVLIAAVTGIIRDGGFTLAQQGNDLKVKRGLTTTRSATVPMRRVQRVTIRRRWVQQALGYASITIHSAGGGGGGEGQSQLDRSLTVPLLPLGEVDALVHRLLGVDTTPDLLPHPPKARRRAINRGLLGTVGLATPLIVVAVVFSRPELAVLAVLLLGAGVTGGLLSYDKLASGADDHLVAGRTGLLGTTTELSPLRKTQGTDVRSSFFQRRLGLVSLHVHVAGPAGGIELQDLGELTAERMAPTLLD